MESCIKANRDGHPQMKGLPLSSQKHLRDIEVQIIASRMSIFVKEVEHCKKWGI